MTSKSQSPANVVIGICGGIAKTAKMIVRHRSVVNRWLLPKTSGGTGGLVPARHQQTLLNKAVALGLDLRPEHFFVVPDPKPARKKARPEAAA